MGVVEINRDEDNFKSEQPIRFTTLQKNCPVQEITFWSNQGEALRKISKRYDSSAHPIALFDTQRTSKSPASFR